mmetsp:Transcript_88781/g.237561  ORF Transcript_88781/g.237561 Transcript_88781/m.237561 type:complete len:204 (-) Transcript_88781:607-1218(-)
MAPRVNSMASTRFFVGWTVSAMPFVGSARSMTAAARPSLITISLSALPPFWASTSPRPAWKGRNQCTVLLANTSPFLDEGVSKPGTHSRRNSITSARFFLQWWASWAWNTESFSTRSSISSSATTEAPRSFVVDVRATSPIGSPAHTRVAKTAPCNSNARCSTSFPPRDIPIRATRARDCKDTFRTGDRSSSTLPQGVRAFAE